jgi:propionyl-CoA carboxylase beta chain
MFITGPDIIRTVTGEEVDFEELGGGRPKRGSGRGPLPRPGTRADALGYVKELLALPS